LRFYPGLSFLVSGGHRHPGGRSTSVEHPGGIRHRRRRGSRRSLARRSGRGARRWSCGRRRRLVWERPGVGDSRPDQPVTT